jgi:ATP phosphoribosyltransferase
VAARRDLAGLQGPTIASLWSSIPDDSQGWYMVTVVVAQERMLELTDHLRGLGGAGIAIVQVQYVFEAHSDTYERLLREL